MKLSYLNINGLLMSGHIECLRSDHNLMSSDITCIAETKLRLEIDLDRDVSLKDFDVVQRIDNGHGMKYMGIIMYRRKSIKAFPVQIRDQQFYQSVICHLPCGIVCFLYIHPQITSAARTDLIENLSFFHKEKTFCPLLAI